MKNQNRPKSPGVRYEQDKSGYEPPEVDLLKLRPPPKITERKVPTKFRCNIKWEWFREFSFWERIKILFGCNLVVMTGCATQHSPGEFQPMLMGRVSYDKNASEFMQRVCSNIIEEQAPTPAAQAAALHREPTTDHPATQH